MTPTLNAQGCESLVTVYEVSSVLFLSINKSNKPCQVPGIDVQRPRWSFPFILTLWYLVCKNDLNHSHRYPSLWPLKTF